MKLIDKAKDKLRALVPVKKQKGIQQNTDPGSLLQQAIEKGMEIDKLSQLLDIYERWEAGKAKKAYFKALANFQYECPEIEKKTEVYDKYGQLRYRYAKIEQIINQIKEPLKNNGLTYRFTYQPIKEKEIITVNGKTQEIEKFYIITTCHITHIDGHTETTPVKMPIDKSLYMSDMQKVGTAQKYGDRYSLSGALGIVTQDEDIDGNNSMQDLMKDKKEKAEDAEVIKEKPAEKLKKKLFQIMESDVFSNEEREKFAKWVDTYKTVDIRQKKLDKLTQIKEKREKEDKVMREVEQKFDQVKEKNISELKKTTYEGVY